MRRRWPDRAGSRASSKVAEYCVAVGADPLHVAVDAGEVDGAHDAAVAQGLAVAVLVVGVGLVEVVVVDERDGRGVGAERRARDGQAPGGAGSNATRMPSPQARSSPAWWSSSKITKASRAMPPQRVGLHGHLLVGDDDAVHVGGQPAVAGRPLRLEVQAEAARGARPLELEVLGRGHHDDPPFGVLGQVLDGRGEGEGGLAGARGGHREEVRPLAAAEAFEGLLLPGPEADGTRHRGTAECTDPLRPPPPPSHPRTGRDQPPRAAQNPTSSTPLTNWLGSRRPGQPRTRPVRAPRSVSRRRR